MDHGKALNDLKFLSKRFSGLLDLGEDITKVQAVLSDVSAFETKVASLRVEISDLEEVVANKEKELKEINEYIEVAGTKKDVKYKEASDKINALKREAEKAQIEINKKRADAEEDAKTIVSRANFTAKENTAATIRDANRQLDLVKKEHSELTKAINDLKARF